MSSTIGSLLLQVVLILINAFFAASEIAVISLNEGKVRRQMENGDKKAGKLLRMVSEPTGFLSTIQVGITLAGFLGSAFAADNFSSGIATWLVETCHVTALSYAALQTLSVIVITLILSYFTLIFGELVPKRLAMRKPEKLASAVASTIIFFSKILKPIVWFLSISTNGVLRLFGVNPHEEEESVSEDEIRMMIDLGEESGTIESEEREMIDNIFEFNNTTAGDLMVHRKDMTVVWANDPSEDIHKTIVDSGFSRLPVCGEDTDDVLGILLTREYLLNVCSGSPKPLRDLLSPVHFVPETVHADALFRDMQQKKIHLAIVVDEYGGTAGLITLEDLLEEIVGNIYDETDEAEVLDITPLGENLWRVSGNCDLEDLSEALGVPYEEDPDASYTTLGGLIFSQLTQIPEDGNTPEILTDSLRIQVEKIQNHRVEWALVSKLPPAEKDESDGKSGRPEKTSEKASKEDKKDDKPEKASRHDADAHARSSDDAKKEDRTDRSRSKKSEK